MIVSELRRIIVDEYLRHSVHLLKKFLWCPMLEKEMEEGADGGMKGSITHKMYNIHFAASKFDDETGQKEFL